MGELCIWQIQARNGSDNPKRIERSSRLCFLSNPKMSASKFLLFLLSRSTDCLILILVFFPPRARPKVFSFEKVQTFCDVWVINWIFLTSKFSQLNNAKAETCGCWQTILDFNFSLAVSFLFFSTSRAFSRVQYSLAAEEKKKKVRL